jgi:hypothetical protein
MRLTLVFLTLVFGTADARPSFQRVTARHRTSLATSQVLMTIGSAYMGGINRCYQHALKQSPSARRGIAVIDLVVAATGMAHRATKVRSPIPAFDSCLKSMTASWRFPRPRDERGAPVSAAFELQLALTPR